MPRNIDMVALRSFVTVADAGGVTRAAGFLNLTQSAVSMQLKRLEDQLGLGLMDRSGRGIALTTAGEQLLGYARRMLAMNDEVFARLTHQAFEGEIVLGVSADIVYPAIPQVLQRFNTDYPRMKVQLVSSNTRKLRALFARGACDVILTTEDNCGEGGETLTELPLIWIGAPGGSAWKTRPLRLGFETGNIFRQAVETALDQAGIAWEMAVDSEFNRAVEASVSADLAVHCVIGGTESRYLERINHGGALPELPSQRINLYRADMAREKVAHDLVDLLRRAYRAL